MPTVSLKPKTAARAAIDVRQSWTAAAARIADAKTSDRPTVSNADEARGAVAATLDGRPKKAR